MPTCTVEEALQSKGLNAPRLTPTLIADTVTTKSFYKLTDVLTVCVLTLRNGFTVTGESACASPENFDKEIGERIAYEQALDKIWALEGYLLKQLLHDGTELPAKYLGA